MKRARPPVRADPLRLCIFTTVAVLTWVLGPVVVTFMSGAALAAYGRAWRQGARRSRCILGDLRLVMTYLAVCLATSVAWTVRGLV